VVVDCVVRHYRELVFAEPRGGGVTVVYPIQFNARDDADAGPSSWMSASSSRDGRHAFRLADHERDHRLPVGPKLALDAERVQASLARDLHDGIVKRPRTAVEHHRCPLLPQLGQYHLPDPSLSASSNVFSRA
jgi:hypothetical protein